jgi:hypothetical protein
MKFEKIQTSTVFSLISLFLLWVIFKFQFDTSILIRTLSSIFLAFPLVLLTIFAIEKVRNSVRKHYSEKQLELINEIHSLRESQDKMKNLEDQIDIDRKILELRESMRVFSRNRFEKSFIFSLVLLLIALILTFFDFGSLIQVYNPLLQLIFFMWGFYYIFFMIQSLSASFR